MGNFSLNEGIPWITNTDGAPCFVCKRDTKNLKQFLFDCPDFREHFDSLCQTSASKSPLADLWMVTYTRLSNEP